MTTDEKFWLDRYLYEIPLLTCDDGDLDYPAIISRFHYLLLKKDKETYEEFVKYWAILIITAPDVFDSDKDKHFKHSVFSKVKGSAIKLNRPTEKIELPPGQPELEPADNFRYENWKPFFDVTDSRKDMDDLAVYRWYTDPANTLNARSFFGAYCMLLLRAYNEGPSTTLTSLEKIELHHASYGEYVGSYWTNYTTHPITPYAPNSRISFSLGTATFIRDSFRSQFATYQKVLRIVLDWNEYHIDRVSNDDNKRRCFFDQHVKPYFIYYGLNIMKFAMTRLVYIGTWLELKSTCEDTGSEKFLLALKSIDNFIENFDGLRLQDGTFLKKKPYYKGQNCRFWPYSRLFSLSYLESLGDENNLELLGFCHGYKNLGRDFYSHHYNCFLANFMYCSNTHEAKDMIQRTEEEIERGWNQGQAIYTSQKSLG